MAVTVRRDRSSVLESRSASLFIFWSRLSDLSIAHIRVRGSSAIKKLLPPGAAQTSRTSMRSTSLDWGPRGGESVQSLASC